MGRVAARLQRLGLKRMGRNKVLRDLGSVTEGNNGDFDAHGGQIVRLERGLEGG